jgi:pyrroloquinoline quinone (PQQ) biosynthesis protein C
VGLLNRTDFELATRRLCDAFFVREGLPDAPFGRLLRGELTLVELKAFFVEESRWETSLFFNQFILTTLMEKCPDETCRVRLWKVIFPEYGCGLPERSHTALARAFYSAIGVPEVDLPVALDLGQERYRKSLDELRSQSFVEILAGRFLGPETVGPKVFGAYADALEQKYGMTPTQVEFYRLHGVEDENDSALLFELLADYARTEEEQTAAHRALRRYYDQPRIRAFCAIRPLRFDFEKNCRV